MAEGVVSFGVQKLWELLSRESERLQGVDEQVAGLKRHMRTLQSLLNDADAKKYESERVRNLLEDVKDIVDDAEDIIESFLLKEIKEEGINKHVKRFSCFLVDRRKFATDIEGVTERISAAIAQLQNFGIIQKIDGGRSLSLQERQRVQRETRQTFPKTSEKGLVGVEQSVEELVGHLMENDNIQVVSVSGMGGIGKTTLARQVFHHDIVRRHFDGFAWICVSQEFTRMDIWQRILQDLRPHDGDIKQMNAYTLQAKCNTRTPEFLPDLGSGSRGSRLGQAKFYFTPHDGDIKQMDAHTLQAKLFQLLKTSRYLIVLDDVWKNEDWDQIKDVFPQERGSKIILTSRNEGVGLHADRKCFAFRPRILTPEESWNLLESIVFPTRDETGFSVDEELKAVGMKMVTYCGGLPLAVKVLGGLLANKKYTVSEWNRVYQNIGTQVIGNPGLDDKNLNSVYRILSLSYDELPTQLKHCFLYLAHFPEDSKIDLEKLFHYWAAEGIITSVCNGATIQEIGEDYLEELVRRNMVIVGKKWDWSWRWDYCQMHDIMREVCLSKAKEENFLQVIKASTSSSTINAHTPTRSRRIVVHSADALDMVGRKNNQKSRSVLCFGLEGNLSKQSVKGILSLQLLRVLDLSRAQFKGGRLPYSIGELIHLRFLSLYMTSVSHIPSSLRNLKLLLYLDLFTSFATTPNVPDIFKEMVELRYLSLPRSMISKTKLELGNLVNLEYLWNFSAKQGNVTDLLRMTRLRTLNVILSVNLDGKYTSETLPSSLRELRNLEKFLLVDWNREAYHEVDFVWDFINLRDLTLELHMPRFPDQSQFPPHLANISLHGCMMEEDPLPILEKLLHLKSVYLSKSSFVGRRMVCSKGGFPQLCKLEIYQLYELEDWVVEEGSMPCLRILMIKFCRKLKEVPDGLKYITSLKEMVISDMKGWMKKLLPGGESYYKVQHIPSVQFEYCDDE